MDHEKEKILIGKYLSGNATEKEIAQVERWYIKRAKELQDHSGAPDYDLVRQKMWDGIQQQNKPVRKLYPFKRIAAAAAIIVCSGLGAYTYFHSKNISRSNQIAQIKNDIKPGGNKAYLTLAGGQRIILSDAKNGQLAQQAGVTITKTSNGQLIYAVLNIDHNVKQILYNTIETPRGGQYQVQLPDGTDVWLNAASTLKYPVSFVSQGQRRVELSGEGYFQVARDKAHPFVVVTDNQEVTVLGTHFNINSYAGDPSTKTTLLEGSVLLNGKLILKPGEQASRNSSGVTTVESIDTEEAVAWKNGYFQFDGENLETAMRKIARWYNVEVEYKNNALRSEALAGTISKYSNVSQVLKKMELTGVLHFKIEGRKIMVL